MFENEFYNATEAKAYSDADFVVQIKTPQLNIPAFTSYSVTIKTFRG